MEIFVKYKNLCRQVVFAVVDFDELSQAVVALYVRPFVTTALSSLQSHLSIKIDNKTEWVVYGEGME